jgi:hypothetical protein
MPGRIISFGIVMSSTWTNSAGASVTGSATMQIDKSTVTPQFYVQTTVTAMAAPSNPGTGTVVGGAGLGSGQGVTQSVRAAGDGNTANNNVDVNVTQTAWRRRTTPNPAGPGGRPSDYRQHRRSSHRLGQERRAANVAPGQ